MRRNIVNCIVRFNRKGTFYFLLKMYTVTAIDYKGQKAEVVLSLNLGSNSQCQFSFSPFVKD